MRKSEKEHPAYKYGTDKQYLEWLSYQPSCLSGEFNQYIDGIGRNIACHVRNASNSGVGVKPPFSAVPMTDLEHKYQHQHGELAGLNKYLNGYSGLTTQEAKEFFNFLATVHLRRWIESRA